MTTTLRLLLGDQLNLKHSWFAQTDEQVLYVLMEIRPEATYVTHHIQKLLGFFAAMRRFAEHLTAQGHRVRYLKINDADNAHSFEDNLRSLLAETDATRFGYQLPDEYRLDVLLSEMSQRLPVQAVEVADTEHFMTERGALAEMFKGKKQYLMETFYRQIRKKFGILLEPDGSPTGERWNFDAENRKKYKGEVPVPPPLLFSHNLQEIFGEIEQAKLPHFGEPKAHAYPWCLDASEARTVLQHFVTHLLPYFGTYQDALHTRYAFLFHSRLSFALNLKMIAPLEVVEIAVAAWQQNSSISLAQVEGFVRQIIGWREYMRGIYWAKMPEFASLNYFEHHRKLPDFYWTGNTHMRCVQEAVRGSLQNAYAHHIQRLMVTGNFALLAGISPDELDAWYLGIYIDALDWVEITNTRGMSQFADGGIVGTKPYVSSANYLHKMSNYCTQCTYDHKKRHGANACPFNSLYWHFYHRHAEKLQNNPRIGMAYRTWEKIDEREREKILAQAEAYLARIEML